MPASAARWTAWATAGNTEGDFLNIFSYAKLDGNAEKMLPIAGETPPPRLFASLFVTKMASIDTHTGYT
jgi:hypothetical protein